MLEWSFCSGCGNILDNATVECPDCAGKIDKIAELDEELLPYNNLEADGTLCMNIWLQNVTANIL